MKYWRFKDGKKTKNVIYQLQDRIGSESSYTQRLAYTYLTITELENLPNKYNSFHQIHESLILFNKYWVHIWKQNSVTFE